MTTWPDFDLLRWELEGEVTWHALTYYDGIFIEVRAYSPLLAAFALLDAVGRLGK